MRYHSVLYDTVILFPTYVMISVGQYFIAKKPCLKGTFEKILSERPYFDKIYGKKLTLFFLLLSVFWDYPSHILLGDNQCIKTFDFDMNGSKSTVIPM